MRYEINYSNKIIKSEGFKLGSTFLGKWKFYNTNGELIKIINYDKKQKYSFCEIYNFLKGKGLLLDNISFGYDVKIKHWTLSELYNVLENKTIAIVYQIIPKKNTLKLLNVFYAEE